MGTLKKFEKRKEKPSPLDPMLMESWQRGFKQGVKQQREADINNLVNLLEGLEEIKGIGDKKAMEIRLFFLDKFDKWRGKDGQS